MYKAFLIFALGLGLVVQTQAQSFDRIDKTRTNTAFFFFAQPGDATIQISLWGSVRAPGIYEVPVGTNLDKLLTMAGGPPPDIRESGTRREVIIRLFREQGAGRTMIYEASLDRMLVETEAYPVLQDYDVLTLETIVHRGFGWRDALSVIISVGTLILIVERLIE